MTQMAEEQELTLEMTENMSMDAILDISDITGLFPGSFTNKSREGVEKIKVDPGNGEGETKRF